MVDQDFIGSIRTVEQQADELIEAARQQAAKSVEEARVQAADIIAAARKQAEQEQSASLAEAQKKIEIIETEAAQIDDLEVPENVISDAAGTVAERIVKYSVDR